MNTINKIIARKASVLIMLAALFILSTSVFASAVQFNITKARQQEWDRYEQYKADYIKANDLEGYEQFLSERNLQRNFGFYSPSHYYISPQVLAAKYNPPLQGEAYCTKNRGCTASIYQPSAVKFYGEKINGRYTGAIPSTLSGTYFDHPQANMNIGYVTVNYGGYNYNNHYNNYAQQGYVGQIGSYARVAGQLGRDNYFVGYY